MLAMHGFTLDRRQAAADPPAILAIDTTAGRCSAALLYAGDCAQSIAALGPTHSRRALAMVSALLERHALRGDQLDAVAFGAGPGSFTGLRIACGIAQGLGFGWRRPVVPVDSMTTLAWQACRCEETDWVLVAIDARMGEVYRAAFRRCGSRIEPLLAAAATSPQRAASDFDALACGHARISIAGDGFLGSEPLRAWAAARRLATPEGARHPEAAAVAHLAAEAFGDGLAVAPADAAPVYLRDKVALDVGEQAALRAGRVGASR
jgi:tRNA threonylcarbamoyladenosine biosynthesis protein TsaB